MIEDEKIFKNIMKCGIMSALVWKKDLLANPSTIKKLLNTKARFYVDEATNFHDK